MTTAGSEAGVRSPETGTVRLLSLDVFRCATIGGIICHHAFPLASPSDASLPYAITFVGVCCLVA
jgi:hypothetical protein